MVSCELKGHLPNQIAILLYVVIVQTVISLVPSLTQSGFHAFS